jgi:hypothetical protein
MAEDDGAAYRAWELLRSLLSRVAPKVGGSASDVPQSSPHGPGHSPPTIDAAALQNVQAEAYYDWQQGQEQQNLMRAFEAELGMLYPGSLDPMYRQDPLLPQFNLFDPLGGSTAGPLDPQFAAAALNTAIPPNINLPHNPQVGPTPVYGQAYVDPQLQMDLIHDPTDPTDPSAQQQSYPFQPHYQP